MRIAGGRVRGEARLWAQTRALGSPEAGVGTDGSHAIPAAASFPWGGLTWWLWAGLSGQAETCHAPAPLLPPGGLGALLHSSRVSESSSVTTGINVRSCLSKFPPPHIRLDRMRGSGRFPDIVAVQNQKTREPGGASLGTIRAAHVRGLHRGTGETVPLAASLWEHPQKASPEAPQCCAWPDLPHRSCPLGKAWPCSCSSYPGFRT